MKNDKDNNPENVIWAEDRLDELIQKVEELVTTNQRPASEVILDDSDVMQMLKMCKRSLAALRAKNVITWYKVGGKVYYRLSDVLEMLDRNKVLVQLPSCKLLNNRRSQIG